MPPPVTRYDSGMRWAAPRTSATFATLTSVGFVVLAACGGASESDIFGPAGSSATDSGAAPSEASASDASTPEVDGGGGREAGGGKDAGLVVTEQPAPDCNDLGQQASLVARTASLMAAPTPSPITTIPPGLYEVTHIVDYNGALPLGETKTRTTVLFTATRQYYVNDDSLGAHQQITLDWAIANGKLNRSVVCTSTPLGTTTVSQRVGASPNGFTVFIDNLQPGNRTETVRYQSAK